MTTRAPLSFLLRLSLATALISCWFAALLGLRAHVTGMWMGLFLVFNLFLAGLPLLAAWAFEHIAKERRWIRGAVFVTWLLFLPNAPYLGTDLLHLRPRPPVPLWFDAALLGSAAACGIWLGYLSVAIVHRAVAREKSEAWGWAVACIALALSGVGLYVGRFLRWNSWDLFVRPGLIALQVFQWIADPASARRGLAVAGLYGGGLVLGYIALRLITVPALVGHGRGAAA